MRSRGASTWGLRGRRSPVWGGVALYGLAATLCAAVGLDACGVPVPRGFELGLLGGVLLLGGVGVFVMASGVYARVWLAGPGGRARVALTFDDGPDAGETRRVMTLLEAAGHRGTFFVIGERAAKETGLLAEIVERGHGLGNHSYDHSYLLPFRRPATLAAELEATGALLAEATGRAPRWFRPPVGLLSPRVAEAARRAGLELVGWSVRARDGRAATTVEQAVRRLERGLRPGAIVALHDGVERGGRRPIAAEVLVRLLPLLAARGLRSVTLDELLDDAGAVSSSN